MTNRHFRAALISTMTNRHVGAGSDRLRDRDGELSAWRVHRLHAADVLVRADLIDPSLPVRDVRPQVVAHERPHPSVSSAQKASISSRPTRSALGQSVSLSADGNTAVVGGSSDNNLTGAVWLFTR